MNKFNSKFIFPYKKTLINKENCLVKKTLINKENCLVKKTLINLLNYSS